ncbi:MAG: YggS family pyridoxal phosphate-dependent enzyme [Pseudomonadota bacterium]
MSVSESLSQITDRIASVAKSADREPSSVELVAVSKVQPSERIEAALAAGHRLFGENRVQEAETRWKSLRPRFADLRLHLIGPLQTNKVRPAVALFDCIESVDRPKLARALAREFEAANKRLPCLIQVNTGEEPQKAGVLVQDLDDLVGLCKDELGLPLDGLMCIPPIEEAPAPHFALLADLAHRHGLPTLSMGMSGDFETAIRHGATRVRVGSAVFGPRPNGEKPSSAA